MYTDEIQCYGDFMKYLCLSATFGITLMLANSALAADCALSTTTGIMTWANQTYTPVDAGQGTEHWLCLNGHIYRPHRQAIPAAPQQHAPATHSNECTAYSHPYYRNHVNEIPSACMSDEQRTDHNYQSVERNI